MTKTIKFLSLLIAMCICFSGFVACAHKHDFICVEIIDATCAEPQKQCFVCDCGAEETVEVDEPSDHYWIPATCEKPKYCMYCNITEGSIIDCFGGTGTTMIAAEQLDRKCYMLELDPHYCDIILARWEKLTGNKAIKLNE